MASKTLKKLLFTSIGIASITIEKIQKTTQKFIKQEKISETDGKQIVDNFVQHIEVKKQSFKQEIDKLNHLFDDKLLPNPNDIFIESKDTILF
ncbi:MAG: hypothetical protein IPN94_26735 [Sphingobacteriales bacterium]|nr:hypothetical protein [Sphingobacteriales bacterium]